MKMIDSEMMHNLKYIPPVGCNVGSSGSVIPRESSDCSIGNYIMND